MFFKNPYGFLIKHFRLIHLILTGFFVFLAIKLNSLLNFYNNFINGVASKLDAMGFVTNYYIIVIILSIIICVVVYSLLGYKKKPRLLYVVLIGFLVLIAVLINIFYDGLETIYISVLDTKSLRLYRDLLRILVVFQYIAVAVVLVRGLGFDIKKFNFVKDLAELNLDAKDVEEVELTLGSTNNLQRKFNRKLREFKYYYLENKMFIHIILIILVVGSVSSFIVKEEVVDKEFEQGESFSTEEFQIQLLDSYVTVKDYDNNIIKVDGSTFVVAKIKLASLGEKKKFNSSNLILEVNNNSYSNDLYYSSRFSDLGYVYKGSKIGDESIYIFVYNILMEDAEKKMRLVYADEEIINLNPIMLDDSTDESSYKLGNKLDLSNSTLGSGFLTIENFEINDSFVFPYEYEVEGKKYTNEYNIFSNNKVIIKLLMNGAYPDGFDNYTFLEKYGVLKYKIGEEEYSIHSFSNKTPGTFEEGLYLALDEKVLNADSIWFDIRIRNQRYIYNIK